MSDAPLIMGAGLPPSERATSRENRLELFEQAAREIRREAAPLADRMRPTNLDEFVGQEHVVGEGSHALDPGAVGVPAVTAGYGQEPDRQPGQDDPGAHEASGFHGMEPNEGRWNIDWGTMDSYSGRISVFPSKNWMAQFSAGKLTAPEHQNASGTRSGSTQPWRAASENTSGLLK